MLWPTGPSAGTMRPMETLRTPDDRFRVVPDFGYPTQYAEVADADGGTLRVA